MKKLVVIMVAMVLTFAASAQKRGGFGARPRTYVVVGGGGYYSPFYSPFYNPYYYPGMYGNSYYHRPTKLDMQVRTSKVNTATRSGLQSMTVLFAQATPAGSSPAKTRTR